MLVSRYTSDLPEHRLQLDILVSFVKLLHVLGGIYMYVRHCLIFLASHDNSSRWEYVSTIQFEWQIITRKRKCRWTILVRSADRIGFWSLPDTRSRTGAKLYSGCRLSTLRAIGVIFIGFNSTTPIDCKVGGVSSPLNRHLAQPVHVAAMVDFFICAFAGVQRYVIGSSHDVFCTSFSAILPSRLHPAS